MNTKRIMKSVEFSVFGLVYFLVLIFYKGFSKRRKKKVVGFASGFFGGNIKYLLQEMKNYAGVTVYFVTGNTSELDRLKSSNVRTGYYMNVTHIPLFLRTRVWVTSHGPANIPFIGPLHTISARMNARLLGILLRYFLYYWKRISNSKLVDVWHGVAFKRTNREKMLLSYDVGFVTSAFFKRYYSKEIGFSDKLRITGYPRTDPLIAKSWDRKEILEWLGVSSNRKNILYAPTYGHKWDKQFFPWGDINGIMNLIEKFCDRNNCNFLIRMHPNWYKQNVVSEIKLNEKVAQSKRFFHVPSNRFIDVEPILFVSDVLITGWSSIANDFILLDKPIIFLEVDLPAKEFVLKPEERAGSIVRHATEFFEKLEEALVYPNLHEEKRRMLIDKIYKYLDGNASKRCAEQILKLLEE